jgi:hypothetical protein
VRLLVETAFRLPEEAGPLPPGTVSIPTLVDDAEVLKTRLRDHRPAFFNADGDRLGGRGEFIVVLRPKIVDAGGAQVLSAARLEVWTRDEERETVPGSASARPATSAPSWKIIKHLVFDNARNPHSDGP